MNLDDICPECGHPVADGDEWVAVDGEILHTRCAPGDQPDLFDDEE